MNRLLVSLLLPLAMSTVRLEAAPVPQVGDVRIVGPSQSYLGVMIKDVTADDVSRLQLPREEGVLVDEVTPDSPASRAGLENGDVIYEYAGIPVISGMQFRRLVSETPVGRTLEMKVWRDGKPITISATIEKRESFWQERHRGNAFTFRVPEVNPGLGNQGIYVQRHGPKLGIEATGLTDQMADFLGIPGKRGVLVMEVQADTPAAAAGLKAGDVILSVNGTAVADRNELVDALSNGKVELEVARGRQTLKLEADLGPKTKSDAQRL
jgi:serine protease Do